MGAHGQIIGGWTSAAPMSGFTPASTISDNGGVLDPPLGLPSELFKYRAITLLVAFDERAT